MSSINKHREMRLFSVAVPAAPIDDEAEAQEEPPGGRPKPRMVPAPSRHSFDEAPAGWRYQSTIIQGPSEDNSLLEQGRAGFSGRITGRRSCRYPRILPPVHHRLFRLPTELYRSLSLLSSVKLRLRVLRSIGFGNTSPSCGMISACQWPGIKT